LFQTFIFKSLNSSPLSSPYPWEDNLCTQTILFSNKKVLEKQARTTYSKFYITNCALPYGFGGRPCWAFLRIYLLNESLTAYRKTGSQINVLPKVRRLERFLLNLELNVTIFFSLQNILVDDKIKTFTMCQCIWALRPLQHILLILQLLTIEPLNHWKKIHLDDNAHE
jgi:hypothetical protein